MTDEIEPVIPDNHYMTFIHGRGILVKNINEAQSMVLGGILRSIEKGASDDTIFSMFGKLMRLLESLIVRDDDREWLEDEILAGNVLLSDFAAIFSRVASTGEPKKAKPRRAR